MILFIVFSFIILFLIAFIWTMNTLSNQFESDMIVAVAMYGQRALYVIFTLSGLAIIYGLFGYLNQVWKQFSNPFSYAALHEGFYYHHTLMWLLGGILILATAFVLYKWFGYLVEREHQRRIKNLRNDNE